MKNAIQSKKCARCGTEITKRPRDSLKQWNEREFCSRSCINKGRIVKSMLSRLMDNIEIIPESGCWIWTGGTDGRGYGSIATTFGASPSKAHRESYEFFVGGIPEGMVLRHKCDIPCCINPNHLEPGSQKENVHDMVARGRMNPISFRNLRPGKPLHHGASILSIIEKKRRIIEQHPILSSIRFKGTPTRTVVIDGVKQVIKGE